MHHLTHMNVNIISSSIVQALSQSDHRSPLLPPLLQQHLLSELIMAPGADSDPVCILLWHEASALSHVLASRRSFEKHKAVTVRCSVMHPSPSLCSSAIQSGLVAHLDSGNRRGCQQQENPRMIWGWNDWNGGQESPPIELVLFDQQ